MNFKISERATAWQNQQNDLCTKQRLDIRLGIRLVWSVFTVCMTLATQRADSEDSDQTGRMPGMPSLIRVFGGRTDHFVGFVMRRLIS